jgi:hypothetical protein
VQPGGLYRYEILLPDTVRGDTLRSECFVNLQEESALPPVLGLTVTAGDGVLTLGWDRTSRHSGFFVERRTDAGPWQRLNTIPRIYSDNYPTAALFADSVRNDIAFEYRIIGVDAFGRESAAAETVQAQAGDLTAPQAPYDIITERAKGGGVAVRWTVPPAESDLAGYGLLRSANPNDGFAPVHGELLRPGTASHVDTMNQTGTYFYRMIAADMKGNISPTSARAMIVIDDTIPPPPPVGLTATADTNGVITLRWRQRYEDDVAGYRIYRIIGGGARPEFVPLNPEAIADTVWSDTLMAGVRDRFLYRVRSVDFAGNYSAPGEAVGIQLPDNVPPARPVLESYRVADRLVTLRYVSASGDVRRYHIRRDEVKSGASPVEVRVGSQVWSDSTARHGVAYRYTIFAEDSTGNVSPSSDPLHVVPFWSVEMPLPDAPRAILDATTRTVRVQWNSPGKGFGTIVFRRQGDAPFLQISPLLDDQTYIDAAVSAGAYDYALKHYSPEQGGTELGPPVRVMIP